MQARDCSGIFKVLKGKKKHQNKILYPMKLCCKGEREIKTFSDKQKQGNLLPVSSCEKS